MSYSSMYQAFLSALDVFGKSGRHIVDELLNGMDSEKIFGKHSFEKGKSD